MSKRVNKAMKYLEFNSSVSDIQVIEACNASHKDWKRKNTAISKAEYNVLYELKLLLNDMGADDWQLFNALTFYNKLRSL